MSQSRREEDLFRALKAVVKGDAADALESGTLDFKEEGRSRNDLLKEVAQEAVCFANSDGGTVVIGVRDKPGGPEALTGTDIAVDQVARRIYELSLPPLTVDVDAVMYETARLVAMPLS